MARKRRGDRDRGDPAGLPEHAAQPAIAAAWSGASCRLALFDAGSAVPMPTPVIAARWPATAYGETGRPARREGRHPTMTTTKPITIGQRYPVRRSAARRAPADAIMPTARAVSSVAGAALGIRTGRRRTAGQARRSRARCPVQEVDQVHHAEAAPAQQPVGMNGASPAGRAGRTARAATRDASRHEEAGLTRGDPLPRYVMPNIAGSSGAASRMPRPSSRSDAGRSRAGIISERDNQRTRSGR